MEKIKIDGQQIVIPTCWEDIKLGDYEKWHFNKPQDQASYIGFIADLCKVDASKLQGEPESTFEKIENSLGFVLKPEFIASQSISINGEQYRVASSNELTLGEWVDMDSLLSSDSTSMLSDVLAIVCRPIGELYDHKKSMVRSKLFREQSCAKMMPLVSFFLCKKQKFNETLNQFLMARVAVNQFLRDTKSFAVSGDGIKRLPIWHRIIYFYLTKSLGKQLSKFSDSYFIV